MTHTDETEGTKTMSTDRLPRPIKTDGTPRFTDDELAAINDIRVHLDMISRARGNGADWDTLAVEYGDDVIAIARLCVV